MPEQRSNSKMLTPFRALIRAYLLPSGENGLADVVLESPNVPQVLLAQEGRTIRAEQKNKVPVGGALGQHHPPVTPVAMAYGGQLISEITFEEQFVFCDHLSAVSRIKEFQRGEQKVLNEFEVIVVPLKMEKAITA